jgi:hypothetical protein
VSLVELKERMLEGDGIPRKSVEGLEKGEREQLPPTIKEKIIMRRTRNLIRVYDQLGKVQGVALIAKNF